VNTVNGVRPSEIMKRQNFEDMTPIFPDERIHLDVAGNNDGHAGGGSDLADRKGQRGMIVSPPKAGKTTLLKADRQSRHLP
jgi:transcription termination factor Rho